jgi:hypothetical protein
LSGPWTGDGEALPAGFLHHDDGPPGPGFAAGGAMDTLAGRPTLPASPTTPPTTRRRLTTTESSKLTPGSSPASTRGRQPAAEGGPPASRTAWAHSGAHSPSGRAAIPSTGPPRRSKRPAANLARNRPPHAGEQIDRRGTIGQALPARLRPFVVLSNAAPSRQKPLTASHRPHDGKRAGELYSQGISGGYSLG